MNKLVLAGAVAALLAGSAVAANAAVVPSFATKPAHSPGAGYTVIDTFDTTAGITGSGFQILNTNSTSGAPPANSVPFGTNYLSVLGKGSATIAFSSFTSAPITSFQFDWGSVDTFNTLTINYTDGTGSHSTSIVPGSPTFPLTNGNQTLPGSNGLFTIAGTAGETFQSITLTSGQNSFEIDNLAIPAGVPEPASWALMLIGVGAMGGALRARRKAALA